MNRKLELTTLLLLYIGCSFLFIKSDPRSQFILLHSFTLILSAGAFLFGNAFLLMPYLLLKRIKKYILINLLLLATSYLLAAFLSSAGMAETGNYNLKASHLIHPASISANLPFLFTIMLMSVSYTYIRHLFILKKYSFLKKLSLYTSTVVILASLVFYTNYMADISYAGNKELHFLEQKYNSLEEIVKLPQFKNKVVYVDLWYSTCGPCMAQFEHTAAFKEQISNKNVAFLYLGRETSHPNSKQRWKNVIRKYNLTGWHFYMSKPMA